MPARTRVDYIGASWNPITGCTKISPGCQHCYAERFALRLREIGAPKYANGFALTLHEEALTKPLEWKRPRSIFVNSMCDLFHKDVPIDFVLRVFDVMGRAHWHRYQILTKRSDRLLEMDPSLAWQPYTMAGVTVENQDYAFRIDHLRKTGAREKFLSMEPLLGPVRDLNLEGIDWVYVGGESGPCTRPMRTEWVDGIREQCEKAGVGFHLKQWGGTKRNRTGEDEVGLFWPEREGDQLTLPVPSLPSDGSDGSDGAH